MSEQPQPLEFRTCVECRENKWCHRALAVCEACWNTGWKPAIVLPRSQAEIEEERIAALHAACVATGGPVIGQVDENGVFIIRPAGEGR